MPRAADETIIPTSKVKLVLIVLGSTTLAAAGLYFCQPGPMVPWPADGAPWRRELGFGGFFLFAFCALAAMRSLLTKGPGLSLNSEGLSDHSGAVATGLVPWREILGFAPLTLRGRQVLVVRVKSPENYLHRGAPPRRNLNRANLSLCGSPFVIGPDALTLEFEELEDLCRHYLDRYGRAGT